MPLLKNSARTKRHLMTASLVLLSSAMMVGYHNCAPSSGGVNPVTASHCSNGAADYPTCDIVYDLTCENGASNFPVCDAFASCGNVSHGSGEVRQMYQRDAVDSSQSCVSETQMRSCQNGNFTAWTGSYQFSACILTANPDLDSDGVVNADDNCPSNSNSGQRDFDRDHVGDVCDNDYNKKLTALLTIF